MLNYPFKSIVSLLQIRNLGTKTSKLVEPSLKVVSTAKQLEPKTRQKEVVNSSEKEEHVIALFKKLHFDDTQIAKLTQKYPTLFRCNVESILEPKLKFLNENGFKGSLLTEVLVKNPNILRRSLSDCLIPNIDYLRGLMKNDQAAVIFVVKRSTWLFTVSVRKIVQPNIDLLLEVGVDMSSVLKFLRRQPRSFMCPVDRMRYGIDTVRKFGIEPTENVFICALRVVLSMNEATLKNKFGILKSLGWSDKDIATTMACQPLCLSQSEDKLRSTFDYFVNTMHVEPEVVINFPKLVMYSLSKRSIPRCKVLMALKEKKLVTDLHMPSLINMPGEQFTKKFILNHPTISSSLWSMYLGNQKVDGIVVQQ